MEIEDEAIRNMLEIRFDSITVSFQFIYHDMMKCDPVNQIAIQTVL